MHRQKQNPPFSPPTTAAIWIRFWWQWGHRIRLIILQKKNYSKIKLFARFIWFMGAFPATWKGDPSYDMLAEAVTRLNNNRHLTIFPEGTRHTAWQSRQRKKAVSVILAAKSGKPVIPVGLIFNSNNRALPQQNLCTAGETPSMHPTTV